MYSTTARSVHSCLITATFLRPPARLPTTCSRRLTSIRVPTTLEPSGEQSQISLTLRLALGLCTTTRPRVVRNRGCQIWAQHNTLKVAAPGRGEITQCRAGSPGAGLLLRVGKLLELEPHPSSPTQLVSFFTPCATNHACLDFLFILHSGEREAFPRAKLIGSSLPLGARGSRADL